MTEFKDIPGNETPDTPDLGEAELRGMHMAELRDLGRRVGLPRADGMRKDELIKEISAFFRERRRQQAGAGRQPETVGQQSGGRRSGGQQGRDASQQGRDASQQPARGRQHETVGQQASGGGQRQTAGQTGRRQEPPGNQSPNTPDLSEPELRRMHMAELRDVARQEGIQEAENMRKDELIQEISRRHRQLHPQA